MATLMVFCTISRISVKPLLRVSPFMKAMPTPSTNDSTSAVITGIGEGISTVNHGSMALPCSTAAISGTPSMNEGNVNTPAK